MINDETEEILAQIFGRNTGWSSDEVDLVKLCPGFNDIKSLAELLSGKPSEESLQKFLEERPQILFGLFGQGDDSDLAFITKPNVGNLYRADFAILNVGQGGCFIHLVELENSSDPLFTSKSTPAKTLQSAIGQVLDWSQWIEENRPTFVTDIIRIAKNLPQFPEKSKNSSFRLRTPESIEQSWRAFGGYEFPAIRYSIIAIRWATMSDDHKKRLVFMNSKENKEFTVFTYDRVARRAYDRPAVWP